MHQNPLRDFEQKFENFIRVWMRYFYNIDEYILAIEIMIDHKKCMLQENYLMKGGVDRKKVRKRQDILEDLFSVFILDKREFIKTITEPDNKDGTNPKGIQEKPKETTEQKNQRQDDSTVWGFDFDNLLNYEVYIQKMKEYCETEKKKKEQEIENNESKIDCDKQKEEILRDEIEKLKRFTDVSLKIVEDRLKIMIDASRKTDIKKSQYHADSYNLQSSQEKDDSQTFQIANQIFKRNQYPRLDPFCSEVLNANNEEETRDKINQKDKLKERMKDKDEMKDENSGMNSDITMNISPEKKKKVKTNKS